MLELRPGLTSRWAARSLLRSNVGDDAYRSGVCVSPTSPNMRNTAVPRWPAYDLRTRRPIISATGFGITEPSLEAAPGDTSGG